MKSLQKEQKAQIMEYKPQSAGINMQSPQSDSTPWTLFLFFVLFAIILSTFRLFKGQQYLNNMLRTNK